MVTGHNYTGDPIEAVDGVNIPLLRKAVEWVEEQDLAEEMGQFSAWNQAHWFIDYEMADTDQYQEYKNIDCGTAFCLAGYIAIELEGWLPMYRGEAVGHQCEHPTTHMIEAVATVALKALGLHETDADELFEPNNSAARIRELAEAYAGEKL